MFLPPMWITTPKNVITRQQGLGDETTKSLIKEKIDDINQKNYIDPRFCVATMNYFAVPKGLWDVHMV